jgi:hypothetical protein
MFYHRYVFNYNHYVTVLFHLCLLITLFANSKHECNIFRLPGCRYVTRASERALAKIQRKSLSPCGSAPRRLLRSSQPQEICQPPQQGFLSVHAQLHLLGYILRLFTPHITSHLILTPNCVNNIILHLLSVLCTAVNVRNKNLSLYVL